MRNALIGGAWILSLVLAWLVGTSYGPFEGNRESGSRKAAEPVRKPVDAPSPEPKPRAAAPAPKTGRPPASGGAAAPEADDADEPYTLEGVDTVQELSRRFMKFAERKLAAGPEGHKELFKELDHLMQNRELRPLFRDEAALTRLAYPWVKFLVDHDRQVVALAETIYRTAAEEPSFFEGLDDDSLEALTEGVAVLLPGLVADEQLGRFRKYAEIVLAMPKESLPEALQRNLRELQKNLEMWSPPVAPEEAVRRIMDPATPAAIRLALLERVDPADLGGIDLTAVFAPALEQGNRQAVQLLQRFSWSAGDLVALDRAFLAGAADGRMHGWQVSEFLRRTRRTDWEQSRPFVEQGLRQGGKSTALFAESLGWLRGRPPKEYVQQVLATYDLPPPTVQNLKKRFGIE